MSVESFRRIPRPRRRCYALCSGMCDWRSWSRQTSCSIIEWMTTVVLKLKQGPGSAGFVTGLGDWSSAHTAEI